jgi:prephenate dehydratase
MSLPTASPAAPAASLDHLAADTLFYLGPLGTYSHAVAQSLNARRSRPFALEPCVSITACAARAAQAGQLALLPYENSSFGPVGETNAVLVRQERLYVVAEAIRAVRHSLLCSPATLERLTAGRGGTATDAEMAAGLSVIFSHEQVSTGSRCPPALRSPPDRQSGSAAASSAG